MTEKIYFRFVFMTILVAMLVTTCGAIAYYTLFEKQVHEDMQVTAQIFKDTEFFQTADISLLENNAKLKDEKLRLTLMEWDGTVLFDNTVSAKSMENHGDRPEIIAALENGWGEKIRKSDTLGRVDYYYAIVLNDGRILRISKEVDGLFIVIMAAMPYCGAIIIIVSIIGAVVAKLLTNRLMTPILQVAENIDGEMDAPYPELYPFISKIRKQHDQVLESAQRVRDFSANASHELKTPLTAISGYAQLIQTSELEPDRLQHFSQEIDKNANRLLKLIDDIIELSNLDAGELETQFETVDLYELAKDELEILKINADNRNISLTLEGESTRLLGQRDLLTELIDNLVENSIRYNNPGGHVSVKIFEARGRKQLIVEDDGIGIPSEDFDRIFERFYRVDKSRSKATGGTGLGLSIVKHIVELHDGSIHLESRIGEGTKITVIF